MGLDCRYQAVPEHLDIIGKAVADRDFAENVFYPFIAFCETLESLYYFSDEKFDELRWIYQQYPDVKNWSFKPISRMQSALVYLLEPESYNKARCYTELEKTFAYKLIHGESVFNDHLVSTQGISVRVSSYAFTKECLDYLKGYDVKKLESNFNIDQMIHHGIYKINSESTIAPMLDYFNDLTNFYGRISEIGNLSVFVVVD
jgi:Domain of unknown function (DUF1877)